MKTMPPVGANACRETDQAQPDVFEMHVHSSLDTLTCAHDFVSGVAKCIGVSSEEIEDLRIAVMEAVVNAIEHGNKEDRNKQVHIRAEILPNQISFFVRDEGEGFELSTVPDPCQPRCLMNASGRGILMMRAFMDVVKFYPLSKGMLVKMTKFLNANHIEALAS